MDGRNKVRRAYFFYAIKKRRTDEYEFVRQLMAVFFLSWKTDGRNIVRHAYFFYARKVRRTDETEFVVLLDIFFRHFCFRNSRLRQANI